jgi:hypothetical protein
MGDESANPTLTIAIVSALTAIGQNCADADVLGGRVVAVG